MKKSSIIILVCLIIAVSAGFGGRYYYHNYVETVNDYIILTYTPPQQREGLFGEYEYTKPKVELKHLQNFVDDDAAITWLTADCKQRQNYLLKELEDFKPSYSNDRSDQIINQAQLQAIQSLLSEHHILIRSTHIRKFDSEKALKIIKDNWGKYDFDDVIKSNKLEVAIYNID